MDVHLTTRGREARLVRRVLEEGHIARPGHRVAGDRHITVRGAGWEFIHIAIDDHARLACAEILPDERQASVIAFLERALTCFPGARHGGRAHRDR